MMRLALATLALAMLLSSVCLAFPSSRRIEELRLAAAIESGDLSAVKTAAERVDLSQINSSFLRDYVLRQRASAESSNF